MIQFSSSACSTLFAPFPFQNEILRIDHFALSLSSFPWKKKRIKIPFFCVFCSIAAFFCIYSMIQIVIKLLHCARWKEFIRCLCAKWGSNRWVSSFIMHIHTHSLRIKLFVIIKSRRNGRKRDDIFEYKNKKKTHQNCVYIQMK